MPKGQMSEVVEEELCVAVGLNQTWSEVKAEAEAEAEAGAEAVQLSSRTNLCWSLGMKTPLIRGSLPFLSLTSSILP